ncbi:MAG: hypothetical protein SFV15_10865 [Polyangiaceae bacterium]|nr:hypothetical protein [Polyangiaceae bacterium]
MLDQNTALAIVIASVREVFAQSDLPLPEALNADTVWVGKDAVLDSLGVV